jgi:mRNA-degrading endonuclease RelE of RelBE toxin-antitoxin system
MTDRTIDIFDLAPDVRDLVGTCELTGKRVLFTRNGRSVVALVSYDEYLALRETIDIGAIDPEGERTSRPLEDMPNQRIHITNRADAAWQQLDETERKTVHDALVIIDEDPIAGAPLFAPLRGYWSYRIGALRIVYRIVAEARFVLIVSIAKV